MKHQRNSQQNDYWSKLDHEIEAIGQRAKYNLKKFEQQQSQTMRGFRPGKKPKLSVPKSKTISVYNKKNLLSFEGQNFKRTQIYKAKREEEEIKTQIKNRLTYISHEKEKKNQALEQLKKKYEKLVEVRNNSMKEKEYFRKKKSLFEVEKKRSISSKVESVKSSRKIRDQSVRSWKRDVQSSAKELRREKKSNQFVIRREKMFLEKENKKKVQKTRMSLENSRSRLSEITGKRKQMAKMNFMEERSKQLSNLEDRRKKNKRLLQKLKSESERISKQKQKADWQLQNYRSFMGVSPQKKASRVFSSYGSSQSFYVTAS